MSHKGASDSASQPNFQSENVFLFMYQNIFGHAKGGLDRECTP